MPWDREAQSRELAVQPGSAWFETQRLSVAAGVGFGSAIAMSATDAVVTTSDQRAFAFTLSESGWGDPRELTVDAPDNGEPFSVSISGNTLVVGSPSTNGQRGSAFVFTKSASGWAPGPLEPLRGPWAGGRFGAAVAIDGDLLVVGAPLVQSAYVFARVGERWLQQKQLFASDNPLDPGYRNGYGTAVAIAGRTVVVGAPQAGAPEPYNDAGKAYVYRASSDLSGHWAETILLPPERKGGALFGATVATLRDVVLVGAPSEWRSMAGAVYAFENYGATRPAEEFKSGSTRTDEFGTSLAASNGRAVFGARYFSTSAARRPGAAYVFARSGDSWESEQAIVPEPAGELFGNAVAIFGDTILIGAPNATPNGAVYVQRLLGDAGSACKVNGDCGHGHCISGICCETACEGACEACWSGKCLPVASGELGTPACGRYVCDGVRGRCPDRCASHGDCYEDRYCYREECLEKFGEGATCAGPEECSSGNCVERRCSGTLPNGSVCHSATDCARGHCVDGRCCDDACSGQCEACDVAGHEGECTTVEGDPRGDRPACDGDGTDCDGSCNGVASATCEYATSATRCESVCDDGTETVSVCNGEGACIPGDARPCDRFACDERQEACVEHCQSDADCSDDFSCWSDGGCDVSALCVNNGALNAPGNGEPEDCTPFACSKGECMTRCAVNDDCASPYICRSESCVVPSAEPEGCGCRVSSPSTDARWPLASFLGLFAVAWGRARRRARARRSRP